MTEPSAPVPPAPVPPEGATARRLRDLVQKTERQPRAVWSDFDWSRRPRVPLLVPRRAVVGAVSRFLQGEQAAAQVCEVLADRLPEPSARAFLEIQCDDERGHADIYRRYLATLGCERPVDTGMAAMAECILAWRGPPEAVTLACHLLLETETLRLGREVEEWLPCPLFGAIASAIARDEARHVAFGRLYLKASLPTLPFSDRRNILGWLRGLWMEAAADAVGGLGWFGIPWRGRAFLERHWVARARGLAAAGLFTPEEVHRLSCL